MTAPAPTRTNFAPLDQRITHALTTLRLARSMSGRAKTREDIDAEKRAEANLNALLDYRHVAQSR
jgi:hypothetical protein